MEKKKYKIGDKVRILFDAFDEQLPDFKEQCDKVAGVNIITEIKDVSNLKGTTGQWVKTDKHNDWIDSAWLRYKYPKHFIGAGEPFN